MAYFLHRVLRRRPKDRRGVYVGTQTVLNAEGTSEIPAIAIDQREIVSVKFVYVVRGAPAPAADTP